MNKEKQIDKMAKVIAEVQYLSGLEEKVAENLYNAGYRKASEVAEEIFAEIEILLRLNSLQGDIFIGKYFDVDLEAEIAELKKKYTEDGE